MAEIRSALGTAIRVARAQRGWSQKTLAHLAELERSHISDIERGLTDPGVQTLEKIAGAFGLNVSELLAEAERERARRRGSAQRRGKPSQP